MQEAVDFNERQSENQGVLFDDEKDIKTKTTCYEQNLINCGNLWGNLRA